MIIDHIRDIEEFKKLYKGRPMPNQYDFEWLINNPCLYCFYDKETGKLKGFITIQRENGELTLSGTAIRKIMPDIITAIITVCEHFNEDIYAYTKLKHAGLVLRRAGFKYLKQNKFVRYKNGK